MLPKAFTSDYLRQLEMLRLNARRAFIGTRQGSHKSVKRGYGMEFSDYRRYELGDDPRYIDWSVYARNEKLFVKMYEEEQDLSVMLILDASTSMFMPKEDQKWQMARDIALSLAYISLLQQDRVSLVIPEIFYSPYYVGGAAIHRMNQDLTVLEMKSANNLLYGIQQAAVRTHIPGVAIFISDFLMPISEVEALCNILRAKNLDITAIQILGENDLRPFVAEQNLRVIDSESGEEVELTLAVHDRAMYQKHLNNHISGLRQYFSSAGISYAIAEVPLGLNHFIVNNLTKTALLQ